MRRCPNDNVEIRFTIPAAEYKALRGLLDPYRLDIGEVAQCQLGAWFDCVSDGDSVDEETMTDLLLICNEQRETGFSQGYRGWRDRQRLNVAEMTRSATSRQE